MTTSTMIDEDLAATLFDVHDNAVLFHAGEWDTPAGFHWAALDGTPGGPLAPWQSHALNTLLHDGLVTIESGDDLVRLTDHGLTTLYGATDAPLAA
ncbi:hypothetical protein [Actinokineospora inagensis]|uniref:hypothetical protein n=1 Tax=Actinokineospora inagensis TaxID=103730 RepID=UPI00040AC6D7|nr:hypothetical protein [Actinokineospora inagensis]